MQRIGQRAFAELNEANLYAEADEVSAYLTTILPEDIEIPQTQIRAKLPSNCCGCGAPVHSDEVEWIDQKTAECVYCGSPVRGED